MSYNVTEKTLYSFLVWVDTHNPEALVDSWVRTVKKGLKGSYKQTVRIHANEGCGLLDTRADTDLVKHPSRSTLEENTCYEACSACINKGFVNHKTRIQAEDLYRQHLNLKRNLKPSTTSRQERKIHLPIHVNSAVKANNTENHLSGTDQVEKLAKIVRQEEQKLLRKHDTEQKRHETHAWARKLALLNRASCMLESRFPTENAFTWFFNQPGTQKAAVQELAEQTQKTLEKERKHLEVCQNQLYTCFELYENLEKQAPEKLCVITAKSPVGIPYHAKENIIWKYLYANLLFLDKHRTKGVYRIDFEMATWLVYVSKKTNNTGDDPSANAEFLSSEDLDDSVLQVAGKLWEPGVEGPYKNLKDIIPVAQQILQ